MVCNCPAVRIDVAGTTTEQSRGTSVRGQRRRRLLIDAAAELIMTQGFAAVSHRAVAQRADVPLAATTYYFASLDELLEEAVRHLATAWLAGAREVVEQLTAPIRSPKRLAEALMRVAAPPPASTTGADRAALLSLYERYVEAARLPRLQAVIAEYDAHIEALLVEVLRLGTSRDTPDSEVDGRGRLLLAVIDGALLRALAEGADLASATTTVQHLIGSLAAPGVRTTDC